MKKILFAILTLSTLTSTVFAGYNADRAYMNGKAFASKWDNDISPNVDSTAKSKSNWDLCVYLLKEWDPNGSYVEDLRNSAGYDRDWVQGCELGMSYLYDRKGM